MTDTRRELARRLIRMADNIWFNQDNEKALREAAALLCRGGGKPYRTEQWYDDHDPYNLSKAKS